MRPTEGLALENLDSTSDLGSGMALIRRTIHTAAPTKIAMLGRSSIIRTRRIDRRRSCSTAASGGGMLVAAMKKKEGEALVAWLVEVEVAMIGALNECM